MDKEEISTPPELKKIANSVKMQAVPMKSKDVYLRHYLEYREFLKNHKTESISESTLLAYLQHLVCDLLDDLLMPQKDDSRQ